MKFTDKYLASVLGNHSAASCAQLLEADYGGRQEEDDVLNRAYAHIRLLNTQRNELQKLWPEKRAQIQEEFEQTVKIFVRDTHQKLNRIRNA